METEEKIATARGNDMKVSLKQSMAICDFIKGKKIETALRELEEVTRMKRAVPMKGEIPHRKGGFAGRYPIKASQVFIKILKSLSANASAKGMDAEKIRLFASANKASRPHRPGKYSGRKFKRAHIFVSAK
jgi:large subunit ribosomal protein L22